MSKWLKIENPGRCPVEGFVLLGASSKRNSNLIGFFGSGCKMSIALLMRAGISPIVFCSRHKLEFGTRQGKMAALEGETAYSRMVVKHGGKEDDGTSVTFTEELSQTDQYGSVDWTDLAMALREFVSNALDAATTYNSVNELTTEYPWDGVKIEIVDENQVRAKDKFTRVFIPLSPEVQRFYGELPRRFLHFSTPELLEQKILPKAGRNLSTGRGAMIYKRGVFVREVVDEGHPSIFDYNLNDLELDESRNVDDYVVRTQAAYALRDADPDTLAVVFKSLTNMEQVWEATFNKYDLSPSWDSNATKEKRKANWKQGWKQATGNAILCGDSQFESEVVTKRGYEAKVIKARSWVDAAEENAVDTSLTVMSKFEKEGREVLDPSPDAIKAVDTVWSWLEKHNFTFSKPKPHVKCFRDKMEGGSRVLGYYEHGSATVMINEQHASDGQNKMLLKTALEELVHYTTQSSDLSRDFQDFILRLVVEQNV